MADVAVALGTGIAAFLGVRRPITVQSPAAGADWSFTLPSGAWWRLIAARFQLATSAVVATRVASLEFQDPDGNPWLTLGPGQSQVASLTESYNYAIGLAGVGVAGLGPNTIPLPNMLWENGWKIVSRTTAIDAGDQLSGVRLYLEEVDIGRYAERVGVTDYFSAVMEGAG